MNILFFDTETTGFVSNKIPVDHPNQGRCAQLGAILQDHNGRVLQELNALIKPSGWVMGEGAAAVHGFTQDLCEAHGIECKWAFRFFELMVAKADLVVAHNIKFDNGIMTVEHELGNIVWRPRRTFCTMEATTNMCKLPGKFGNYKWPKLQEAYYHLFNESFVGAHDAMADVRACARIFFELVKRGVINLMDYTSPTPASNIIRA